MPAFRRPSGWTALATGCAIALVIVALSGAPALRAVDDRPATRTCAGTAGGRCVDPAVVAGALRLARIGPGELRGDEQKPEVHVDPTQGLVLRSGAGWEIRFGTPDDLELK